MPNLIIRSTFQNCHLISLALRINKRDKPYRQNAFFPDLSFSLPQQNQLLYVTASDRDDHPSSLSKLFLQWQWNFLRSSSYNYGIERSILRPSLVAIAYFVKIFV
jgi:hypothetical protein